MTTTEDLAAPSGKGDQGKLPPTNAKRNGDGKPIAPPPANEGAKSAPVPVDSGNGFGGSTTKVPYFLRRENICLDHEFELGYEFAADSTGTRTRTPCHQRISEKAYTNMQPAFKLIDFLFRWSKPFFLRIIDAPLEHFYTLAGTRVYTFSESWTPSNHAGANYNTAVAFFFSNHVRIFALDPRLFKEPGPPRQPTSRTAPFASCWSSTSTS